MLFLFKRKKARLVRLLQSMLGFVLQEQKTKLAQSHAETLE